MAMRMPAPPTFAPCPTTLTSLTGFRAAGVKAGLKASGNPDVGLLVADESVSVAGVFTQNHFAAAPVRLSQRHLQASGGRLRALLVNSGNANACTGDEGEAAALEMCQQVAQALKCPVHEVLVCSTGVIGVPLPMAKIRAGIDACLSQLAGDVEAGRRFLQAIMTTDAFAKEAAAQRDGVTVAGICKGAGMIQPNMATMLAFVATDAHVSPAALNQALPAIAHRSFNGVHVDTHTSTNDTFLVLATGKAGEKQWQQTVTDVSRRLAWLIARDGEGATKVTTISVRGATDDATARGIANHVAASALVRTALFGNDPNWGRFVSQVGNAAGVKNAHALSCRLQGIEVFHEGQPTPFDRAAASKAMAVEDVRLELSLSDGTGEAEVMTSDLGYRYVEVNAEYTT